MVISKRETQVARRHAHTRIQRLSRSTERAATPRSPTRPLTRRAYIDSFFRPRVRPATRAIHAHMYIRARLRIRRSAHPSTWRTPPPHYRRPTRVTLVVVLERTITKTEKSNATQRHSPSSIRSDVGAMLLHPNLAAARTAERRSHRRCAPRLCTASHTTRP